jgi:predicted MFS family arabinose efflux permease
MSAWLRRILPFRGREAQRLAALFAIVYFAQGMWYLPNQTLTIVLKERGLSAGQVADFFAISGIPWFIKPVYGLVSDFFPLWGRKRKTYLLLTSALAALAGFALLGVPHTYGWLVGLLTMMGFGLAFTDVLVDAVMVESGKPLGLTGAFQSVQWGAIEVSSILVGEVGGYLAERRAVDTTFLLAAAFPLISLAMTAVFVREAPARANRAELSATLTAVRRALADREIWVVAGFIFFFNFSPSFGPALVFYQTDVLHLDQELIGHLNALSAIAGLVGALIYAPLSRRVPLRRLINLAIGVGAVTTLGYLAYRDVVSAIAMEALFGCVAMLVQLAFLDLAAKACPRHVEATFFALMMSVFNGGAQLAQNVGGRLYDWYGYTPLVLISTAFTAAAWLLVPLVHIERIETRAREADA